MKPTQTSIGVVRHFAKKSWERIPVKNREVYRLGQRIKICMRQLPRQLLHSANMGDTAAQATMTCLKHDREQVQLGLG